MRKIGSLLVAMGLSLGIVSGVSHAQTATSIVSLAALDVTAITATPTVAITPVAADYSGTTPNVTSLVPILLTVTTTRPAGCGISVSGAPGTTGIANTDLRLKSATSGSQYTSFTAVSSLSGQTFWNSTSPQVATIVSVDVNVNNLVNYPGTNLYTNTLTWTVTPH